MEQTSLIRLAELHPLVRQSGLDAYADAVKETPVLVHPFITEVFRSFATSDKYWEQGRTTPGDIITYSRGGQSFHNYGLGIDFVNLINGKEYWPSYPPNDKNWMIVVNAFKRHGWQWGGDFPKGKEDWPHFQKKLGYTWQQLLAMHHSGKFIGDTAFLRLTDNSNLA